MYKIVTFAVVRRNCDRGIKTNVLGILRRRQFERNLTVKLVCPGVLNVRTRESNARTTIIAFSEEWVWKLLRGRVKYIVWQE